MLVFLVGTKNRYLDSYEFWLILPYYDFQKKFHVIQFSWNNNNEVEELWIPNDTNRIKICNKNN